MLVGKVFARLREAVGGISGLEKGAMVAATQIAIEAVDDFDAHAGYGVGGDVPSEASEVAGLRVVFAAYGKTLGCLTGGFVGGSALSEESDYVGGILAIISDRGAYDVILVRNVSGSVESV